MKSGIPLIEKVVKSPAKEPATGSEIQSAMSFHRFILLIALLFTAPVTRAAITLVGSPSVASDDSVTGHTTFSNVTVQAGDYVVLSTASNKSFANNLLTYSWTGTEGISGMSSTFSAEVTYGAYVSYTSVLVGGTYDFSMLANNASLTANSALYVLRPDSGEMIFVADTAMQADAAGTGSALSYSFASILASAFAIEAATTQSGGAFTLDANYLTANSSAAGNGRLVSYSSAVTGGSWSSLHDFVAATDDIASVGAVFSTSSVPEPSRALLLAIGFFGWMARRRR